MNVSVYLFLTDLFHPRFLISAMTEYDMVNFPFWDGRYPRSFPCGVRVSQLIRFAWLSGRVAGFGARGGFLTAKLLHRGCRLVSWASWDFFGALSPTLWVGFRVQSRNEGTFAAGPVGAGGVWFVD